MLPYFKCLIYLLVTVTTIAHSLDITRFLESNILGDETSYEISKEKGEKVELQVYYECLCPGCREFHTKFLHDIYKKIGSYINLKLFPYGNAKTHHENGKTVIKCQHGPEECYGNKLHACAILILNNVNKSESYTGCMMEGQWGGDGSTDMDATKCGELMKIDSKPIIGCANSKMGETLLEYYGTETDKTHHKFVPWLLINGKVIDYDKDFFKQLCDALANPPPECKNGKNFEKGTYQKCCHE